MTKTLQRCLLGLILLMLGDHALAQVHNNQPIERNDENSKLAHQQLLEKVQQGKIDIYFVGDSITRRWGATDYPQFLEHWRKCFHGWNAANFGWGGDTTQNILWRLENGELQGVSPKVFVVLAGTNNISRRTRVEDASVIAEGIGMIVDRCRKASPDATVLLMAILPREDQPNANEVIDAVNEKLLKIADGKSVKFININEQLMDSNRKLKPGYFPDKLHPSLDVYEIWAAAISPVLEEVLGPKASTDHAPPPTGDPKAKK